MAGPRWSSGGLIGCQPAQRLLRRVAGDPQAGPATVGIVGRGGTGKSALVEQLAGVYAEAGMRVEHWTARRSGSADLPATVAGKPGSALLVDDAQWLDAQQLQVLTELAAQAGHGHAGARLVVAHRPWPRPAALAALDGALSRERPLVVLGTLDRAGVAERVAGLLGRPPEPSLVAFVLEWTEGLPSLTDSLVTALADEGQVRAGRLHGTPRVPNEVHEVVRAEFEQLDPVVRTVLAAISLGAPVDERLLAVLVGVEPTEIVQAVESAQAVGLMSADGTLVRVVRSAVEALTPLVQRRTLQERLAELLVDRGGSLLDAATHLLGAGAIGARAAALLEAAGQEALADSPELARSLLDHAVRAGARPEALAARRAAAAAAAGDLDEALRFADLAVADPDAPDRVQGIQVTAAVLAHRGLLGRSALLYRSLAEHSPDSEAAFFQLLSVPGLLGTGKLEDAADALAKVQHGVARPLSLLDDAVALSARGLYETITGSTTGALSALVQAASLLESSHRPVLLADTPAALAAVVAHHSGDFDVADSVLERAITAAVGEPLMAARHRLLQGWTALRRGQIAAAKAALDHAHVARSRAQAEDRLQPRDELYASALAVGIARRQSDLDGLMAAWRRGREALMRHPVDLFVLQPLGELVVGAARLGELRWVQSFVQDAWAILERLGKPALWSLPLRWYALQAGIAADDRAAVRHHAEELASGGAEGEHAEALALAARTWVRVLGGEVDAEKVDAAVRRLEAIGLIWDAARLAGAAAIRVRDPAAMRALLGYARSVQATTIMHENAKASGEQAMLSDREREVASFVLAGLTYKEIGVQLFISSKTVEHHVARIRQRLGASTRAELLAKLRTLFTTPNLPD